MTFRYVFMVATWPSGSERWICDTEISSSNPPRSLQLNGFMFGGPRFNSSTLCHLPAKPSASWFSIYNIRFLVLVPLISK